MHRAAIVTLIALSATACVSTLDQSAAIATLPFEQQEDRRIVVETHVNGQGPYRFAIDTAASISAIFEPLSDQLAIARDADRKVMVQGLVKADIFPPASLDSIALGEAVWRDVTVVVLPAEQKPRTGLDGILGLDFLRQYIVLLSKRDRLLRIYNPGQLDARHYRGWATIALHPKRIGVKGPVVFATELQLGTERIPAIVDLGAGFNIMNFPAATLYGFRPETLSVNTETSVSGALGTVSEVYQIELAQLKTASVSWKKNRFIVADLSVFDAFVEPGQPAAILGVELLFRRDIVIDLIHERLLVNNFRIPRSDRPPE